MCDVTRSFVLYVSFIHMRVGNVMSSLLSHSPSPALSLSLSPSMSRLPLLAISLCFPTLALSNTHTHTHNQTLSLSVLFSLLRALSLSASFALLIQIPLPHPFPIILPLHTSSLSFFFFLSLSLPPPFPSLCLFHSQSVSLCLQSHQLGTLILHSTSSFVFSTSVTYTLSHPLHHDAHTHTCTLCGTLSSYPTHTFSHAPFLAFLIFFLHLHTVTRTSLTHAGVLRRTI